MDRYHSTSQRRWTQSAKECYFLGCNCSQCFIYTILGDRCMMKGAVLELVRKLGKPEREHYEE